MQRQHCFKKLTLMLSDISDQVGLHHMQHGKRVAYMATECFLHDPISGLKPEDVFISGLLHDIGVSSSNDSRLLLSDNHWKNRYIHCVTGAKRIQQLPFFAHYASAIQQHHTPWKELKRIRTLTDKDKKLANLIHLTDQVDALLFQHRERHPNSESILAKPYVYERLDNMRDDFSDDILASFFSVSEKEAFWFTLEPLHLNDYVHSFPLKREVELSLDDIEIIATILSMIIDAKSPFTAEHSYCVGLLSFFIAQAYGLPQSKCQQLRISGLLHDIGKLRIPDSLLDKKGPLTTEESMVMHRHSYEAYSLLSRSCLFDDIQDWACHHHEYLDGSGYPYRLKGREINIETRILTIADIFQALVQKRPYRESLDVASVMKILQTMADQGKIDHDILNIVIENKDMCWQLASNTADLKRERSIHRTVKDMSLM
mgnify:CR=1 FL=1